MEHKTRAAYCERCGYTGTFTLVGKLWRHIPASGRCGHAIELPKVADAPPVYSIIGTSPSEGCDYWVPYCPTFTTPERAEAHARAVWGSDWQGGRYSLRVGIITPDLRA